ncbi:unnamed protein product [Discosporangium mesarthrocarpum]
MFFNHRENYPQKEVQQLLDTLLQTTEMVWDGALQHRLAGRSSKALLSLEGFPAVAADKVKSYRMLLGGPLRPSVASSIFTCSSEAIRRSRTIINDPEEREKKVCQFFQILCRYVSDHLLVPSLRACKKLLPRPASNVARAALQEMTGGERLPTRDFYEAIRGVTGLSSSLEDHYKHTVAPGMEGATTLQTIARDTLGGFLQRVDGFTEKVLQRSLELLVVFAERELSNRSNKNDYCPKEDSAIVQATRTTKVVCAMLEEQYSVASECLKEMDLRSMWAAVGMEVHRLFVEHLKRTKVNVIGAFILTNDVNRLQEVMGSFDSQEVTSALDGLRELINLFVVPPENLTTLMEQGVMADMGRDELKEFVRIRADYHTGVTRSQWARDLFAEDEGFVSFGGG